MSRVHRTALVAEFYHVVNRSTHRRQLFFDSHDFRTFLQILRDAPHTQEIGLLAYCVMPNHWHLVVAPSSTRALSAYMHWITGTHARQWNQRRGRAGQGHVYQGRFRSFPIRDERHLLAVLRYVEANPVRAGLVEAAARWMWSSAADEGTPDRLELRPWPLPKPSNWSELVNNSLDQPLLDAIRIATLRGREVEAQPGRPGRPRKTAQAPGLQWP